MEDKISKAKIPPQNLPKGIVFPDRKAQMDYFVQKRGRCRKNIEYITPQKSITACTYFLMSDNAKVLSGVILLVPESKNLSVEIESQILNM